MDAGMRGWSAWRHGLGNLVSSKLQLGKQSKELSELCAEKDDNYKSRVSFIVLNSALNLFQLLWKAHPAFLLWSLPHPSWFYWIHVLTRKADPTIPDSYNGFNGRRKNGTPGWIRTIDPLLRRQSSWRLNPMSVEFLAVFLSFLAFFKESLMIRSRIWSLNLPITCPSWISTTDRR